MTADMIKELKERVDNKANRKVRFWMLLAIISLIVGLTIGFVVSSENRQGVVIEVMPP